MAEKPNILFILTDQQSATMMSCADNAYVNTPAMDSIAMSGVRFDRAYCTNSVCVPSRFSLMTGLMPSAIGMLSNRTSHIAVIPESMKHGGLGHLMSQAGYDVAYAGKVHLPKMSAEDVGFNYICQNEREQLADTCAEFIKKDRRRPFFLVASFINPHDICYMALRDFMQTERERRLVDHGRSVECMTLDAALKRPLKVNDTEFFADICPPLPPNFEPQATEPEAIRLMLEQRPFRMKARDQWSEKRWREHRWAYARLTEMVDRHISRVLDALKDSEQANRTLVIFTSDHGDMDAAHRLEHKSTLYDEACRIPLIIRPPGGTKGRIDSTHLVSNGLDLVPTFCDWAGITPPPGLPGRSLRELVEDGSPRSWRGAIPVECAIGRAIITDRFKYCLYDIGTKREQLADLKSDPWEQENALDKNVPPRAIEPLRALFKETFGSEPRPSADILKAAADA